MNRMKKNILFSLLIIGTLYVILGFSIGINAFFIPFIKEAFKISTRMSYLVMTATFSAYVIFGVPSGIIFRRLGYKKSIMVAFLLFFCGFSLIGLSAQIMNFILFLVALFVVGMGQTILTSVINSYVTILGPHESAAKRISIMGVCDKLAFAGASFILAFFMSLTEVSMGDVVRPFYFIAVLMIIISILIYNSSLPELKAKGEGKKLSLTSQSSFHPANFKKSILEFPHLLLGVIAIFFDVGVEYLVLGSINDYAAKLNLLSPSTYVWLPSIGMVIGYFLGIRFIPRIISQSKALMFCAVLGIITVLFIIFLPDNISIYLVGVLGLCNSLLWPTIFPLALADLGKFTKKGSSILVMGIIGGAILPLLFGFIADLSTYSFAYIVCLPAYLFIFYYAVSGYKIRTKSRANEYKKAIR